MTSKILLGCIVSLGIVSSVYAQPGNFGPGPGMGPGMGGGPDMGMGPPPPEPYYDDPRW